MPQIDWITLAVFVALVSGCLFALDRVMAKARRNAGQPGREGRTEPGPNGRNAAKPSVAVEEDTNEMGHP